MTRVETIEAEVQNLQIEKDAASGKLEQLFESSARLTLKELLLAETPRAEIPVPSRRRWR